MDGMERGCFAMLLPYLIGGGLFLSLLLITSGAFWMVVLLPILGVILFLVRGDMEQKKLGFLNQATGYITCQGVDNSKLSALRVYPDKLTINDIQIIPIEEVKKATYRTSQYGGGRYQLKETHYLTITYRNKDGRIDSLTCESKENQWLAKETYEAVQKLINEQANYVEPQTIYPNKPYQL